MGSTSRVKSRRPDDVTLGKNIDLGVDPEAHKIQWTVIHVANVMFPMKGRTWFCREALVRDQYNNLVIVYLTKLFDGETYEWKDWMKPSIIKQLGGSVYDPLFPKRLFISDACHNFYRLGAVSAFLETEKALQAADKVDLSHKAKEVLSENVASPGEATSHETAGEGVCQAQTEEKPQV